MKAVRLIKPGQPLIIQEIDIPKVSNNDVLVRVKAAGICHSDVHYRAGKSEVEPLPLTLGHEVAGIVEKVGATVINFKKGDRVCLHYMVTCGNCIYCNQGNEQFCISGKMIGKYLDGGFAEYISIPARSVFLLPQEISFEQGAIMMCSSATSLHAIRKVRVKLGDSIAIFGVGGLGISAIQLAFAYGASHVYAVDINANKLKLAKRFGAIPINAQETNPLSVIMEMTGGRGVDVSLELIGLPLTMKQAVKSLAIGGRAGLVGITDRSFEITPYYDLLNKEAEIIGVSDHLAQEIPLLIGLVQQGKLNLSEVITNIVPLDAYAINEILDHLEKFGNEMRVVIKP